MNACERWLKTGFAQSGHSKFSLGKHTQEVRTKASTLVIIPTVWLFPTFLHTTVLFACAFDLFAILSPFHQIPPYIDHSDLIFVRCQLLHAPYALLCYLCVALGFMFNIYSCLPNVTIAHGHVGEAHLATIPPPPIWRLLFSLFYIIHAMSLIVPASTSSLVQS